MKYLPYPKYRDSGVEWIGEIPEGWETVRLQDFASTQSNSFVDGPFGSDLKTDDYTEDGVPLIQLNNVGEGNHKLTNLKFVSAETAERLSRHTAVPGDIVIAKMADPLGRATLVDPEFGKYLIVADCVRLRTGSGVPSKFVAAALNSPAIRFGMESVAGGSTRTRINLTDLKKVRVPWPRTGVAVQIASFLDVETAKIDNLVGEYEALIALLTEKRQALISHAVTGGLSELADPQDPEFGSSAAENLATPVRFVDSGVEWIGEIPDGWRVLQLRRVLTGIEQGWSPNAEDRAADSHEWSVLKLSAVKQGRFVASESKVILDQHQIPTELALQTGDVLLTRANTPQLVGDACVVEGETERTIFSDLIYRLSLNRSVIGGSFLVFGLAYGPGRCQIELSARGSSLSMVKISHEAIKSIWVGLPELLEQSAIASFLTRETTKIDTLVRETQDAIELLKEHRSALITAAVTGKINVEGYQTEATV